ncbi:MAG: DUF2975 domain-containing protein [Croceibacterium sp.]
MVAKPRDGLLVAAKIATILVRIGLVIGMIGLGVATTIAVISPEWLSGHLIVQMEPDALKDVTGAAVLVTLITLCSLGLMFDFVERLAKIIDTVGQGDPFTADNAARLTRMGWLALIVQLLGIPVMLMSTWLSSRIEPGVFEISSDPSFTGFALALVLFILARVFREGAAMRDDLEGTV